MLAVIGIHIVQRKAVVTIQKINRSVLAAVLRIIEVGRAYHAIDCRLRHSVIAL